MSEISSGNAELEPEIRFVEDARRYEAVLPDGEEVAYMTVEKSPGLWTIRGTWVPPSFSGRGVGSALARRVLDEARAEGVQIYPQCQFLASYIKRNRHEADLVHPEHLHLVER